MGACTGRTDALLFLEPDQQAQSFLDCFLLGL